jgi:hypothetical protein
MRRTQKGKQKHKKKQSRTRSKGIACVSLPTAAAIVIVILITGFLAFRNHPSPANEAKNSSSQTVQTNGKSPADQKSPIVYRELDTFPGRHCFPHKNMQDYYAPIIVTTQKEYQQLSSSFKSNSDLCKLYNFPTIDFDKHTLLVGHLVLPICIRAYGTESKAYRNEKEKKIVYEITYKGNCHLGGGEYKPYAVLLPKLPGYTVGVKAIEKSYAPTPKDEVR